MDCRSANGQINVVVKWRTSLRNPNVQTLQLYSQIPCSTRYYHPDFEESKNYGLYAQPIVTQNRQCRHRLNSRRDMGDRTFGQKDYNIFNFYISAVLSCNRNLLKKTSHDRRLCLRDTKSNSRSRKWSLSVWILFLSHLEHGLHRIGIVLPGRFWSYSRIDSMKRNEI